MLSEQNEGMGYKRWREDVSLGIALSGEVKLWTVT
jgi:hypothetical protein